MRGRPDSHGMPRSVRTSSSSRGSGRAGSTRGIDGVSASPATLRRALELTKTAPDSEVLERIATLVDAAAAAQSILFDQAYRDAEARGHVDGAEREQWQRMHELAPEVIREVLWYPWEQAA